MERLDLVIEPDLDNPYEIEGVLNPAAARGPDGHLYLFPRMVAKGNYSRIGIMRVQLTDEGEPCGVERLGVALEPEMAYELRPDGGGCEDPRVTYVEPLAQYVMAYTAFGPEGPRIALAISSDLLNWQRLGLASFVPYQGIEFNGIDNKDATMFPLAVASPSGALELAILHRPLFPGTLPEQTVQLDEDRDVDLHRESIWISYSSLEKALDDHHHLPQFTSHHRLAAPVAPWEALKIGSGTPPIITRLGWLIVYHGVSDVVQPSCSEHRLTYSAGVMVLSVDYPQELIYRSPEPVLVPVPTQQRRGTFANVVFPTGIDQRTDIDQPHRYDVYFGVDDFRIGVARLDVPASIVDRLSDAAN
jgi:predicted GH43/DUF377 family glycosyl hydrolase